MNFCISPAIVEGAIDTQRGFIHGRQLAQNAVDLDYFGRAHAFAYRRDFDIGGNELITVPTVGIAATLPLLVLYDFASAFPSVAHAWLFCVLRAIRLWPGFYTAIHRLYQDNHTYASDGGFLIYMFPILCGILQGCPLSGSLFVLVIDPLLWMFRLHINSALRVCADDIGAALRRLEDLVVLHRLFSQFKRVSLLTLKPAKCILIMTVCDTTAGSIVHIREWLSQHIPEWRQMQIAGHAKYLGLYLGPSAGAEQWRKPIQKFLEITAQLKDNDLPMALAVRQFNSRAVPVLGYKAQMVPPPRNIIRIELTGILQALKLAGNSLTADTAYMLKDWLGLDPVRPSIYMEASMMRAAFKTLVNFESMHIKLTALARESLPLNWAFSTSIPPGWDCEAFCTNLYHASKFERKEPLRRKLWEPTPGVQPSPYTTAQPSPYTTATKMALHRIVADWRRGLGGKSLQKQFYNCIRDMSRDKWCETIQHKVNTVLTGPDVGDISFCPQTKMELMMALKGVPVSVKSCYLKTIINSWSTSQRYHEDVLLPCIFGCSDQKDCLEHYLVCDPMWTCAVTASSLPTSFLSLSPIERLCIFNPGPLGLKLLGLVYRGYHTLKLGHRGTIDRCIDCDDHSEIILLFISICLDSWRHL